MMQDIEFNELLEAKERMHRLDRVKRRQEQLQARLREQERLIMQLELQLESEQEDVEQLSRMTLKNLFHTLLRSKEEQLEKERQDALAAALKLQEAQQDRERLQAEIFQTGDGLAACGNAEFEYGQLLEKKEALLRNSPPHAGELNAMETNIAEQAMFVKDLHEALTAGKRVMASLEDASNSLEKAENWGTWDTWGGGGLISTHMKHEHIDDAKSSISKVNHLMHAFRYELADLEQSIDVQIDVSSLLKFGDYWFDGLITDWIVQKRIGNAQNQTLEALHQVRSVVRRLEPEHTAAAAVLSGLQSKRMDWIERQRA